MKDVIMVGNVTAQLETAQWWIRLLQLRVGLLVTRSMSRPGVINKGACLPGGRQENSRGREPLCALQHRKFDQ